MSELEMKEIVSRIEAMDAEQIKLAVKSIPMDVLFNELWRRITIMTKIIKNARHAISGDFDEEMLD